MSAIGDYVHYREQNYRIWGINRPREKYGNASHYVNQFHQYLSNKENSMRVNAEADYKGLEAETRKNSTEKIMADQRSLNLDYGQKIGQFRSMVIALAEGRTIQDYPKKLSNLNLNQLQVLFERYQALQKRIDFINDDFANGITVSPLTINEIAQEYKALQLDGAGSILGNIQQGYNDAAAKIWKETLAGTLGKKIKECMSTSSEAIVTKAIADSLSSLSGVSVTSNKKESSLYYYTSDSTGTKYSINSTKEGWEFTSDHQRTNILKGSMKSIYKDQFHSFTLSGEKISLGTILEMLEVQGNFGTHWLNRHSNHLDSSMDNDLQTAIVYESLTKGRHRHQYCGDFVFIDRNSGQIEHASFLDVIRREDFSTVPNIMHKKFNNEWGGNAEPSYSGAFTRISNLLQQVHSMNVSILAKQITI